MNLPQAMSEQKLKNLLNELGRKKWNVCIRERYGHGSGVITYLARYVRGGPLSNQKLLCVDEAGVTFRYRDHRDGKVKPMTLTCTTVYRASALACAGERNAGGAALWALRSLWKSAT